MSKMARFLQTVLSLVVLSTMLGLLALGCGNETAGEPDSNKSTGEPTAAQTTEAGGQQALSNLPEFPPAPRDAGNPRLRGSQKLTYEEFVQYVVSDASAKWQGTLADLGIPYSPTGAVTFEGPVDTACGPVDSGGGPFYCSADETVYWPLDWIVGGSGVPVVEYGDFAVAYVAAHEVGHHAQNELGILEAAETGQLDTLDLQTELQADCFAGVWGYSVYYEGLVESGDLDEAMSLIPEGGDAPEQPRGGRGAHGTAEERLEAFLTGYDYGDPVRCLDYTEEATE